METSTLLAYCHTLGPIEESTPFEPDNLVLKIGNKIFGIISLDTFPLTISVKSDPETAVILRDTFSAITPGFHLNKRHWITVVLDQSIPQKTLLDIISSSYQLVFTSLPKTTKNQLSAAF